MGKGGHTARTMTKEDLALTLKGGGVCRRIGLSKLIIGFYINVGAFLQVTKIIFYGGVEAENVMPCCLGLRPS